MSQEIPQEIFDSLPYFDNDLDTYPHLRVKVDEELQREQAKTKNAEKGLHPKIGEAFLLFKNNPLLKAELERVENHQPFPNLDTTRYQLPAPGDTDDSDSQWQGALDNAHAQLEQQRIRQQNISLLQSYAPNAWRIHNYLLEAGAKVVEGDLEAKKLELESVLRERKNTQTKVGNQLSTLESKWTELISSTLQIELANLALDVEIDRLHKKEAELSETVGVS